MMISIFLEVSPGELLNLSIGLGEVGDVEAAAPLGLSCSTSGYLAYIFLNHNLMITYNQNL